MKHCLLKRKEERYEVTQEKADKIQKFLSSRKYLFQEVFFGNKTKERMNNFIYDLPEAKDMHFYQRESYRRARIRYYYIPNEKCSNNWGEWRIKTGEKVIKRRKELKTLSQLANFIKKAKKCGLVPVCILDYERTAFNSKDDCIRITIDRDISYHDPFMREDLTGFFFKKGKPAIIKVKTLKKLPKELEKLFSNVPKRQMTKVLN